MAYLECYKTYLIVLIMCLAFLWSRVNIDM